MGAGYEAEVIIGTSFVKTPEPSRIRGVWRIHVQSATHLPVEDPMSGSSDPFVIVSLRRSVDDTIVLSQVSARTCVITGDLNPEFAALWPERSQAEGDLVAG